MKPEADSSFFSVAVVNSPSDLANSCRAALRLIAAVEPIEIPLDGPDRMVAQGSHDVYLVPVTSVVERGIRLAIECRLMNPHGVTILLVNESARLSLNLAVELVKCAADDLITVPFDLNLLRRKVQRATGAIRGPVLDAVELSPLLVNAAPRENRRHCYRVAIRTCYPLTAQVRIGPHQFPATVADFSIPTDEWKGGILLCFEPPIATALGAREWSAGTPLWVRLALPDGGPEIEVEAWTAAGPRLGPRQHLRWPMQYRAPAGPDAARLQRYWMEAQRANPKKH